MGDITGGSVTPYTSGMSDALKQVGLEVQLARQGAGISIRGLARRAGISSHSRISELESGRRLLSDDELTRICHILGLSSKETDRLLALASAAREA